MAKLLTEIQEQIVADVLANKHFRARAFGDGGDSRTIGNMRTKGVVSPRCYYEVTLNDLTEKALADFFSRPEQVFCVRSRERGNWHIFADQQYIISAGDPYLADKLVRGLILLKATQATE